VLRWTTLLLWLLGGCSGLVEGGGEGRVMNAPESPQVVQGVAVGAGFTRHLTRAQWNNSVGDLLGRSVTTADAFPGDDSSTGFDVGKNSSPALSEAYFNAAEQLASEAAANLGALLPCSNIAIDDDCVQAFLDDFATRAYRRPLTDAERTRLMDLFHAEPADGEAPYSDRERMELVIHAILASPNFLYLEERTPPGAKAGDVVKLSGYETATRLAFYLWNSGPDRALLDAAGRGALAERGGVLNEARRMLEDPKARRGFRGFYEQWLLVASLPSRSKPDVPDYDQALVAAMTESFDAFVDELLWERPGTLSDLFTGDFIFVNDQLAPILGTLAGGSELTRMTGISNRAGILTQPAILAVTSKSGSSDPIHRGKFVRERLLCTALPPPPPTVDTELPPPQPGLSTRERFSQHRDDPNCEGCHRLMDPIGFGFENFDGVGRFRADESGKPVDASGDVFEGGDVAASFTGVLELSANLAASETVADCLAKQLFRYGVGRSESTDDKASFGQLRTGRGDGGGTLRATIEAVVTSDGFLHRQVTEGETP
jgi:hypothetical protein